MSSSMTVNSAGAVIIGLRPVAKPGGEYVRGRDLQRWHGDPPKAVTREDDVFQLFMPNVVDDIFNKGVKCDAGRNQVAALAYAGLVGCCNPVFLWAPTVCNPLPAPRAKP